MRICLHIAAFIYPAILLKLVTVVSTAHSTCMSICLYEDIKLNCSLLKYCTTINFSIIKSFYKAQFYVCICVALEASMQVCHQLIGFQSVLFYYTLNIFSNVFLDLKMWCTHFCVKNALINWNSIFSGIIVWVLIESFGCLNSLGKLQKKLMEHHRSTRWEEPSPPERAKTHIPRLPSSVHF